MSQSAAQTRISVVSFDAYPLLDPCVSGGIGGAEVRATTFAKGLQQFGKYDIEFVVADHPQLKSEASGFRIRAYTKHRPSPFTKLQRSIIKRFAGRAHADPFFTDLDAEALLCFGVRNDSASILRAAKESGKRTVLFLTSDRNIQDAMRVGRKDRGIYGELGYLCRYSIEQADRVVVQSRHQLHQLKSCLGINGVLIRNPINLDQGDVQSSQPRKPVALWVGRADTFSKRADLCVELAKLCPSIEFCMVMNNHDAKTYNAIRDASPDNVSIIERVPFEEIETYFARSTILINTSSAEGFPNSFLQAAKYGKPIVSLDVDPGEMFASHACGHCADGDLKRMAGEVIRLSTNSDVHAQVARNVEQYVHQYHDATSRCDELQQVIADLLASRPATSKRQAA